MANFRENATIPSELISYQSWTLRLRFTRIYINTPVGVVGSLVYDPEATDSDNALTRRYFHYDHQSSVVEVTGADALEPVVESRNYNAWGQRRDPDTLAILADPEAGRGARRRTGDSQGTRCWITLPCAHERADLRRGHRAVPLARQLHTVSGRGSGAEPLQLEPEERRKGGKSDCLRPENG